MILRMTALAGLALGILCMMRASMVARSDDTRPKGQEFATAKKALQEVQDFIGLWNLEGTQKFAGKTTAWKEKVSWGWKFKDGAAWITVSFAEGKGKYFLSGDLNYDVEKKKYVLTLTPAGKDDAKQEFVGDFAKGSLKVERKDPKTGDVHRITMNTLAEGEKFKVRVEKQDGGKGPFGDVFTMNGQKDGIAAAGGPKKPECIVSGGAANIAVQYNGKTYYVCCSGCRDEFNANPARYVKEYEAKKAKQK
jgi:YHS domain-containing protein